jgi:hypothetical protein
VGDTLIYVALQPTHDFVALAYRLSELFHPRGLTS